MIMLDCFHEVPPSETVVLMVNGEVECADCNEDRYHQNPVGAESDYEHFTDRKVPAGDLLDKHDRLLVPS